MSLYDSEMLISVRGFKAYCDICQRGFAKPLEGLNEFILRRSMEARLAFSPIGAEPFDSVPLVTREMILSEMLHSGWKQETIHGKEFIVCKECSTK